MGHFLVVNCVLFFLNFCKHPSSFGDRPKWNIGGTLADVIKPEKYKNKHVDVIVDFKPSSDILDIDVVSFDADIFSTFNSGKNGKAIKNLASQDFDFLYDEKKGGLYFNENGAEKGFGDGGIIAKLDTSQNPQARTAHEPLAEPPRPSM